MVLFLCAIGIFLLSGFLALVVNPWPNGSKWVGAGGAVLGCLLGLIPTLKVLLGAGTVAWRCAWDVPYGAFQVELDPLSAFFLLPIFGLSALAAWYGASYLQIFRGKKKMGPVWFFYNLLVASMAMVVAARNGVLFLMAWEAMSLASFFLVTFEDEKKEVREAGWIYLVATHLGTAFLLGFFIVAGQQSGSLDFDRLGAAAGMAPSTAPLLFLLALIGFGTKAGLMPLHVWLPEAHPAAPSHVSAVMSGVMIKTGIYGILRTVIWLGMPLPAWCGWLLVGIGIVSGVFGILFALAQHNLKRLLAYSSIENMGLIAIGIGVGMLGLSYGSITLVVLGFGGGLLHVLNHSLFKGLLFLGAGAVLHGTHSLDLNQQGALLKRMPWTGTAFFIGAAAITALPPLNGFASEFLLYLGAFQGVTLLGLPSSVPFFGILAGLALIGGLAAACFTKTFGLLFLGEPRNSLAAEAHEVSFGMKLPMLTLAAGCLLVGVFSPLLLQRMAPVLENLLKEISQPVIASSLSQTTQILSFIVLSGMGLVVLIGSLALLRRRLLSGRPVKEAGTWDCGYAKPTARMQYTASSFAQPLLDFFKPFLQTRRGYSAAQGFFPKEASLETETGDLCQDKLYRPAFQNVAAGLSKLRWLQHGHLPLYVLYIALTLLVLLVWKLGAA